MNQINKPFYRIKLEKIGNLRYNIHIESEKSKLNESLGRKAYETKAIIKLLLLRWSGCRDIPKRGANRQSDLALYFILNYFFR